MIELIKLNYETTQEAYDNGFNRGERLGFENGREMGYMNGWEDGEEAGYTEGFEEGETTGYNQGYTKGETDGKTEQYNEFWDYYLQPDEDGLIDGSYMFAGKGWKPEILNQKDKPNLSCKNANSMFRNNTALTDMWFWRFSLYDYNADMDYMFYGCENLERAYTFKIADTNTTLRNVFYNCLSLHTINRFIFNENTKTYTSVFYGCNSLRKIGAQGTIDGTGLSFTNCPLSVDSMVGIIKCLKKQPTGTTKTITFGSTNLNQLTAAEKAVATGKGWTLK